MSGKNMKFGFYGAMANNTYVIAKRMAEIGADVSFIRDRMDGYGISQPSWEDVAFDMSYADLISTSGWNVDRWSRFESEKKWVAPAWLVDPIHGSGVAEPVLPPESLHRSERNYFDLLPPLDHAGRILHEMQQCDCLVVSSTHALILALASDRPFFICPAGGEFMIAAGLIPGEGGVGETLQTQGRLIRRAFRRSRAVVTHTPFLLHKPLVGSYWKLFLDYGRVRFRDLSMPYVPVDALPAERKREQLNALLDRAGVAPVKSKFAVLVPSRIDYRWKGQDRILEAMERMRHRSEFTFIFSGWGADYLDFQQKTAGMDNVRLLRFAMSKPRLYEYFRGVDLAIDQFTLGHYGTATREAISVGTPVMTWVDEKVAKLSPQWRPAPIIQARDATTVAETLDRIVNGQLDLDAKSLEGLEWTRRHASPAGMLEGLKSLLRD